MSKEMAKKVDLIGVALGWGAQHHEVAQGPAALQAIELEKIFQHKTSPIAWREVIHPFLRYPAAKELDYLERLAQIVQCDVRLAEVIQAVHRAAHFPIVVGGDHTIAVGTWSGTIAACQAQQRFGLLWIDAHMDSHTPLTTPSHAIHGMPLAALLGHGEPDLVDLCIPGAKLNPRHVVLMGVRNFESGEAALLKQLKVRVYHMEEIKDRGFSEVFEEALAIVTTQTKGFGMSIDLDGFDPYFAPGTGSPIPGGLSVEPVLQALSKIKDHELFKALEIAEFDPSLDQGNKTLGVVRDLIEAIL